MTPAQDQPPSRLSRLAFRPGGISLEQAMASVSTRLEPLREDVLRELDALIDELHAAGQRLPAEGPALAAAMHERCNRLIGLAGWFGSAGLVQAGFSLCALLDRQSQAEAVDPVPVRLHLQALRLLRTLPDHAAAEAVVDGLTRVSARA